MSSQRRTRAHSSAATTRPVRRREQSPTFRLVEDAPIDLLDAAELVAQVWHVRVAQGEMSTQSLSTMTGNLDRFIRFMALLGVTDLQEVTLAHALHFETAPGFNRRGQQIADPPKAATRRQRRAAVNRLYTDGRVLKLTTHDPLRDAPPIPRDQPRPAHRPSDSQISRLRFHSGYGAPRSRYACLLALLLCGLTSAETAIAAPEHVDHRSGLLTTPGTRKTRPRELPLDTWSLKAVTERIDYLDASSPSTGPRLLATQAEGKNAQASIATGYQHIAHRAGLGSGPDRVALADLATYRGWQILEQTGSLSEVARALGLLSLDQAARRIGYRWALPEPSPWRRAG